MPSMPKPDISLLTAALAGYQQRLGEIQTSIAQIKKALGGHNAVLASRGGGDGPGPFLQPGRKRRKLSAAARKRIAAAQKRRWAAYRKGKAA